MAQLSEDKPLVEFLRPLHERMDLHRVRPTWRRDMIWSPAEFAFLSDLRLRR